MILLTQQLRSWWPESSGTWAAFGGGLAELCEIGCVESLGLRKQYNMKRRETRRCIGGL
jgi:hypothetical protein